MTEPSFFHSEEWLSLLQEAYRYRRVDLSGGSWSIPVLEVGPLFGTRLVSVPFSDYGGPVGRPDPEEIARKARSKLDTGRWSYLEIRTADASLSKKLEQSGFRVSARYTSRLVDTGGAKKPEELWNTSLGKTARRFVNKALREGCELTEATTGPELERAYSAYFSSVKQLGSPVHSREFFLGLKRKLGDKCRVFLVSIGREDVATAAFLVGKDRVHLWLIYSLKRYKKIGAVYLLDWEGIKLASSLGLAFFDFGRTRTSSGVELYKHHWNGTDTDIYHMTLSKGRNPRPPDPSQRVFRMYSEVWRHLPDPAIRMLGPRVIRSIAL